MSASKGFYSKPWCLVSPGSRGIGLALVRHLLRTTRAPVVATMRATTSRLVLREEKFREECLRNFDGEDFEDAGARLHVIPTDVRSKSVASGLWKPRSIHLAGSSSRNRDVSMLGIDSHWQSGHMLTMASRRDFR